jgi:hypothetical protein
MTFQRAYDRATLAGSTRRPVRYFRLIVLVAVVSASGCTKASDETTRPTTEKIAIVDATRARRGSPERAVLTFMRHLQLRLTPLAIDQYDARVVEAVGEDEIIDALDAQLSALRTATVSGIERESTSEAILVTLDLRFEDGRTGSYAFLLRRSQRRWRIAYDTMLADALAWRAQQEVQQASGTSEATPQAIRAAQRAVARYRNAAFGKVETERPDTERRSGAGGAGGGRR